MKYEYLLCLLLLLGVSYFIKLKYRVSVFKSTKELVVFYLITITAGLVWDNVAIIRGHWAYPGKGIMGIFIGLAPIEDALFVVVTTYFALILSKVLQKTLK